MRHTVIGVFDNDALAEDARNLLVDWGIPSDDIFVHGVADANRGGASRSIMSTERPVRRIFRSMVDLEETEEVGDANEGEYIVVAAVDAARADEVFHLLDDSGAVDIGLSSRFN